MDLKELENGVNPDTHWYYQSKKLPLLGMARRALASGQPLTVVDVGAGSGFFALELLRQLGPAVAKVYLVDTGYSADEVAQTRGQLVEKVLSLPPRIQNGLVLLMDVLEHVPDDLGMLRAVKAACVGDNNHFFITVPAFQSLWSGHDIFLHHYRRYRLPLLRQRLQAAGFQSVYGYYLYGLLFPVAWLLRRYDNWRNRPASSNMRRVGPLVNMLLLRVMRLEMKLTRANGLFGVSCAGEGRI